MLNSVPSTVQITRQRELVRLRAELARLREENERLAALAYRDPLTGLRNRRCFTERINEELCRLKRHPVGALSVICIDVNGFKRLNDTAGHIAGDTALVMVGQVLETLVRSEDLVCRMGGDEFALLLTDTSHEQAQKVVERLRTNAPVLAGVGLGERPLAIGLSSWLYGDTEATLISRADEEMYADKRGVETSTDSFVGAS